MWRQIGEDKTSSGLVADETRRNRRPQPVLWNKFTIS